MFGKVMPGKAKFAKLGVAQATPTPPDEITPSTLRRDVKHNGVLIRKLQIRISGS